MPTPMTTGPEPAPQWVGPMDPYTTEARLCDDTGLISDEAIPGLPTGFAQPPLTWRQQLNNLRAHTGLKPYDGAPVVCTGAAHLAREHIRCTSPAHLVTPPPPARTVRASPTPDIRTAVARSAWVPTPDPSAHTKSCKPRSYPRYDGWSRTNPTPARRCARPRSRPSAERRPAGDLHP